MIIIFIIRVYKSRGENNFFVPFETRDRIDRERKEVALLSALSLETTREKLGATRNYYYYSRDNLLLRSPRGTRDEERAPSLYKTSV